MTKEVRAQIRRRKNEASIAGVNQALAYLLIRPYDIKEAWKRGRRLKKWMLPFFVRHGL